MSVSQLSVATHVPAGDSSVFSRLRSFRLVAQGSGLNSWLATPIDIASLAAFRFLFGVLMAAAGMRFIAKGWVGQIYIEPSFHFAYPGFEWVKPWPGMLMYAHFILLSLLALAIAVGFFYRICTALFFLGFTYVELLDQTAYLNHYYLISLLSLLLIFLPAHRALSFDAWRKPRVGANAAPAWCLNILRFQIGVVYVFAGLAKFNSDWLFRAEPLRIWLAARGDLPLVGHWLEQAWVAYAASWFGAIFDTTIVFFLLSRRTRKPAYLLLILFHAATWLLFNIGMFPWIMIISATVFFPPDWPRYWLAHLSKRFFPFNHVPSFNSSNPWFSPTRPHPILLLCLGSYAAVQLALPLRPYFCSEPAAWTCSGFNCAWQVMIAEKSGYTEFLAHNPITGESWRVPLGDYLTPRQEMMMAQDPYLIRAMAHRIAADAARQSGAPIQVTANAFATLNGLPSQRLLDPNFDLAGTSASNWIVPLKR